MTYNRTACRVGNEAEIGPRVNVQSLVYLGQHMGPKVPRSWDGDAPQRVVGPVCGATNAVEEPNW